MTRSKLANHAQRVLGLDNMIWARNGNGNLLRDEYALNGRLAVAGWLRTHTIMSVAEIGRVCGTSRSVAIRGCAKVDIPSP